MVYNSFKNNHIENLWMSKIVHNAGASIIENAVTNRNFWEKWHFSFGFNRFEYDIKADKNFQYKFMPAAFVGSIYTLSYSKKFDVQKSIQTLTPIFIDNPKTSTFTALNSIVFQNEARYAFSSAHEMIHVFQYDEYIPLNSYLSKTKEKWKTKSKFVNKINNHIYFDVPSSLLLVGSYYINRINNQCYFDNMYEQEANYYSNQMKCSSYLLRHNH